jgi:hypothetical protein
VDKCSIPYKYAGSHISFTHAMETGQSPLLFLRRGLGVVEGLEVVEGLGVVTLQTK